MRSAPTCAPKGAAALPCEPQGCARWWEPQPQHSPCRDPGEWWERRPPGGHGASTLLGAFPCTVWLPSTFPCAFPHVLLAGSRGGECARSFPCRSRCRGCRGAAGLCLGFPWKPRCSDVLRAAEGLQKGKSALSTPLPRALHPVQFPTRSQKALWLFPLANLFIFNTLFQEGMGCQLAKCLRISLDSLEHFFINNFSKQLKGVELSKQKGRWPGTGAP